MSSGKTRLVLVDKNTGTPYGVTMVNEFDVYQEAYDYAYALMYELRDGSGGTQLYLYSYDRTSYKFYYNSVFVFTEEIPFPQP